MDTASRCGCVEWVTQERLNAEMRANATSAEAPSDTQKDQRNGVDRRGTSAAEKASPPLGGSMDGRSGGSISQNGEAWTDGFVVLAYLTPKFGSLVEPQ